MSVRFDQGTPVPLRQHLRPRRVDTAGERGWSRLKNGDLLRQIQDAGYQVFVTTDQSLVHQQKLSTYAFGVVVLGSTSWPRIQSKIEAIRDAVASVKPGKVVFVEI
jgi:hypothetical protein